MASPPIPLSIFNGEGEPGGDAIVLPLHEYGEGDRG